MSIPSIQSALLTAQTSGVVNKKENGKTSEFDDMLQAAMNNRGKAAYDTTDTLELSSATDERTVTRNSLNRVRKLDENGQPFDAEVQTQEDRDEFRKVFHQFVGQTMYGQMLKSMRQTQEKPAYFHGGRAEEIFQEQLDQVLVEKMTSATSNSLDDSMFQLMQKN